MDGNGGEKITLDQRSFKALASETRVALLKKLEERPKTATELASDTGLSVQGVSEHLKSLEGAGLVQRRDDGRKWVYYQLSGKGANLLHPERQKILVLLGLTLLAFCGAWFYVSRFAGVPVVGTLQQPAFEARALAQAEASVPGEELGGFFGVDGPGAVESGAPMAENAANASNTPTASPGVPAPGE